MAGSMGPHLKGSSPPFTPSGKAALLRSRVGRAGYDRPAIGGHTGMLLRWRVDRDSVQSLLPPPLEPIADSDVIYAFFNQTQHGNLFLDQGASDNAALRSVNPHHTNWHEAIFYVRCGVQGVDGHYHYMMYKDFDHGVLLGIPHGYPTKLATFHASFPMAGQRMRSGDVAQMVVSRLDELVVAAKFEARRQIAPGELHETIPPGLFHNSWGIRYFPDYVNPDGAPLVHDLVSRQRTTPDGDRPMEATNVWAGRAEVKLGKSDYDEMYLLEPKEMLESFFIDLEEFTAPKMSKVDYDYTERRPHHDSADTGAGLDEVRLPGP